MRYLRQSVLACGLGAAATSAFFLTLAARSAPPSAPRPDLVTAPLLNWLKVPATQQSQLADHDPTFSADLAKLRADLDRTRRDLAAALEDTNASEQTIRDRCEAVLAARVAVERRITDYLLNIRPHLTTGQQKQLFGLAAEQVRQPGTGNRWRHGRSGAGR